MNITKKQLDSAVKQELISREQAEKLFVFFQIPTFDWPQL